MQTQGNHSRTGAARRGAFTLVEVMVGVTAIGVMFVTLYLAFTQGFAVIQLARENLRATQILQEHMESIRLYTWSQLNDARYLPGTFTAPFYAVGTSSSYVSGTTASPSYTVGTSGSGLIYTGRTVIAPVSLSGTGYNDDLRMVEIEVSWTSGSVQRTRQMRTFVSKYGLQRYVY